MSTAQAVAGFLEEPVQLLLPDANVNDLFEMTAGDTRAVTVTGIIVCNADSAARIVNVWLTKNTTDRLLFTKSVSQDTTETEVLAYPIRMNAKQAARKIRVQAESATADTVTVTMVYTTSSQLGSPGAG